MYKDKDGKMVNDVLDKDGNSVFKSHDAKTAMAFLSKNFSKMRSGELKGEAKPEVEAQDEALVNKHIDELVKFVKDLLQN